MPFTLRNLREDLADVGSNFDGAPDLEFRLARPAAADPVELGVNHEILDHGQLIVYANALGRDFPASWAAFGL